jgi:two-component system, NarL family, sensor histidine kinase BarA
MASEQEPMDLHSLTMGVNLRLEELVDRGSLQELIQSFLKLFGMPMRVFSADGNILADSTQEQALCKYINSTPTGRAACGNLILSIKKSQPEGQQASHACFSGAFYRTVVISYDGKRIGRVVIGPYLPSELKTVPDSLLGIDDAMQTSVLMPLMQRFPRAREAVLNQITEHLRAVMDLIVHSGYKALVTSQMHLASVRESYRELQEKNLKLLDAIDRLRELDRLKSNFLATVSHELRTPLTSIIGYSEMLVEGMAGDLNTEQHEYVQTIRDKGEQLLQLITNLLDLAKMESGTLSLRKGTVGIDEIMAQVVSTLLPKARKRGVALESNLEHGLPALRADGEKLRQIFLNLTDNAIKFTPKGGTVRLDARHNDADTPEGAGFVLLAPTSSQLVVRVSDTGIGIPEEERARVFDPFYQVDSSSTREYGGTGLGLSIVKRLVDGHEGSIKVEANHPRGTVFVVTLPFAEM